MELGALFACKQPQVAPMRLTFFVCVAWLMSLGSAEALVLGTSTVCAIERYLTNSSTMEALTSNCTTMDFNPRPVVGNIVILGDPARRHTWDTGFASDVYRLGSGTTFTLGSLAISHTKLSTSEFFLPSMVTLHEDMSSHVIMEDLLIYTDCQTLSIYFNLTGNDMSAVKEVGELKLFVSNYTTSSLIVKNVSISCTPPSIQMGPNSVASFGVTDAYGFYNALAASQLSSSMPTSIYIKNSISLNTSTQYWWSAVNLVRNVSILGGADDNRPVIDWYGRTRVIQTSGCRVLAPCPTATTILFQHVHHLNLAPLNGHALRGFGALCLFTLTFWPVWITGGARWPENVQHQNVTWTMGKTELDWMVTYAVVVTTSVTTISNAADSLRRAVREFNLTSNGVAGGLSLQRFRGAGVNATYLDWVYDPPPEFKQQFIWNDTYMPPFGLDADAMYLRVTQCSCYAVQDMLSGLQQLHNAQFGDNITFVLWNSMSLASIQQFIPPGGFNVSTNVTISGNPYSRTPTILDMSQLQRFINIAANQVLTFYSLHLVNLPDNAPVLDQPYPPSVLGLPAVTRGGGTVIMNRTVLVVPNRDFFLVKQAVHSHSTVPGISSWQTTRGEDNILSFQSLASDTWKGYDIRIGHEPIGPFPLTYSDNDLQPPSGLAPKQDEPVIVIAGKDLSAGQVAAIAVGSAVGAILLAAAVALLVIRRYKQNLQSAVEKAYIAEEDKALPGKSPVIQSSGGVEACVGAKAANLNESKDSSDSKGSSKRQQPVEEMHHMMQSLASAIEDQHLTILEVVGQGGFGTVYKGLWKGLMVAVKTITFQDRGVPGEKAKTTALMEAGLSASLLHPNLVITYSYDLKPLKVEHAPGSGGLVISDQGTTDWKIYIIQEFCDAGSLRQAVLKRSFWDVVRKQPKMALILDASLEVASGLQHLHSKNIIHGDLNPNNVLLKRDASNKKGVSCKIADFGLSVKMQAGQSHISNMRRGTPFYTAPEVASKGTMTKAADVFSFGVMLWELYHSQMCYKVQGSSDFVQRDNYPKFPETCPAEFESLGTACMASEPQQRPIFNDIMQQLRSMQEALARGQLRAPPPSMQ